MTGGPWFLSGDGSSGFPTSTLLQAEFPWKLYLLVVLLSLQSCCCSLGSVIELSTLMSVGTLPGKLPAAV